MKKILITLILGIFLISLISLTSALDSLGTFEQEECVEIKQTCATCTYTNISSVSYPNSSVALSNVPMTNFGNGGWNYTFCNTSALGRYDVIGQGDKNGVDDSFATYFIITPNGFDLTIYDSLMKIFLIIFFMSLFGLYYKMNEKIDYDRWYNSLVKKYNDKDRVKAYLWGIGYFMIKNKGINYYLIGFPIVLLLYQIILDYNIHTITTIFETIVFLYSYGIIIMGLSFFGKLWEFVNMMRDDIGTDLWGTSK